MAAGKKMAKTEKNVSPSRNSGRKFSFAMDSVLERDETDTWGWGNMIILPKMSCMPHLDS